LTLAVNSRGALARRVGRSEVLSRALGCAVAREPLARPARRPIIAAIARPIVYRSLPPSFSGVIGPRLCNFQRNDGSRGEAVQ
jgi:hypothetical protein